MPPSSKSQTPLSSLCQIKRRLVNQLRSLEKLGDGSDYCKVRKSDEMIKNKLMEGMRYLDKFLMDEDTVDFPNRYLLEESTCDNDKPLQSSEIKLCSKPTFAMGCVGQGQESANVWNLIENYTAACSASTTTTTDLPDVKSDDHKNNIFNGTCQFCYTKGSLIEDHKANAIVCKACCVIVEEMFDHGPEWRQCNNDDNRGEGMNRCSGPVNFFFPKSSQGTIMTGSTNSRLKRKQKWNYMVYKERSLNNVFERISKTCSANGIPKIVADSAKTYYKRLNDCKHKNGINAGKQIIIRGENRISIIAACVYLACKINHHARSVKEIADYFNISDKKVTKGIKQYDKIIKNSDEQSMMYEDISDTPEDYIRRHCPKLGIRPNSTERAVIIASNCCRMKLASDHNPQSIAAGAIMLLVQNYGLDIEKKRIADVFDTSEVTICKIYHKIHKFVEALVDNEITDYIIKEFKING